MMRFVVLFVAYSLSAFTQENVKKITKDRADSLFKAGMEQFQQRRGEAAIDAWKQAADLFSELGEKKAVLRLYGNLALAYKVTNQPAFYKTYLEKQSGLAGELGDTKTQAGALSALGAALTNESQWVDAKRNLDSALNLQRSIHEQKDEAATLSRLANYFQATADFRNGLQFFLDAGALHHSFGDAMEWSNDLIGAGSAYRQLSSYDSALSVLSLAQTLKDSLKDPAGKAQVLTQTGIVYDFMGRTDLAEKNYHYSYDLYKAIKNERGMADNSANLGVLHHNNGNYQEAIKSYQEAMAFYKKSGNRRSTAKMLANTAVVYRDLNDFDNAVTLLQQALDIEKELNDKPGLASHYSVIGSLYFKRGDFGRAAEFTEQSIALKRDLGDRRGESNDLISLGAIKLQSINEESATIDQMQALAILDLFQRAQEIKTQIGDTYGRVTALTSLGQTYRIMKEYPKAKSFYEEALALAETQKATTLIWQIRYGLAKTCQREGATDEAVHHYHEALTIIEDQRTGLGSEEMRTGFFKDKSYVYADFIETLINANRIEDAFSIVERAKSRSFLDLLGSKTLQSSSMENPYIAQLDSLENRIAKLEAAINDPLSTDADRTQALHQIEGLSSIRRTILSAIRRTNEELSSLISVSPLSFSEIKPMLDSNVTMVEYYVSGKFYLIFTLNRDGIACIKKDYSGQKLYSALLGFRNDLLTVTKPNYKNSGRALYDMLIAPVEDRLTTAQVIVVPFGKLHYVPFSALIDPKNQFLIDRYTLSYVPSASVMKFIVQKRKPGMAGSLKPSMSLLAFGNPTVPSMNPLVSAESEVHFIENLFTQKEIVLNDLATETLLKKDAGRYEVIHFACHGMFSLDDPNQSGLFLTKDARNDGKLLVSEIFGLKLDRAQLVVLSACETGLSKVTQGDELIGLTRAFIYAGTPSLIASLWPVSDQATEMLIKSFYQNYTKTSRPEALRDAQRQTKSQPEFAHPYFWSSFGLVGDWN